MEAELRARRVRAVARVDRVPDARQMRRFGEIVAAPTRPHEHVVRKVACEGVRLSLGRRQDATERRDVLVVPRVAVGDARALA